ncbi:MAG: amidophosphoribosyltransferase [Gammaproteobacteria bacterium]|nr:amidophosphoribosyltransferase [Gammaproteobacteria bacterium]
MCGIVGIVAKEPVNKSIYDALTLLQHRGQDASGIATCDKTNRLFLRKGSGLVRDVFAAHHMHRLQGEMGIGHVRYPTAGGDCLAEAQPLYVNSPYGIALAHNGNLTNTEQLKNELYRDDLRHINTGSDSEVLLNVLAHELSCLRKRKLTPKAIFSATDRVFKRVSGAYAAVALITGHGILGIRDPHGIRPLVFGKRDLGKGVEYMMASESVALSSVGFRLVRDVQPGEAIFIDLNGKLSTHTAFQNPLHTPCIFEYVYLARPDSRIDNVWVYSAHLRMGEKLAKKIQEAGLVSKIDVVIPIPETSRPIALQLSQVLGLKYREGFVKNRYIGRTFIMPGQVHRRHSVRQKLNTIDAEFKNLNVLLVDDSIVRGTTSQQIIQMAREAGAKKVFFASASPPVRYPNVYGIDMAVAKELIAHKHSVEEICRIIGADALIYQDLEDLKDAVREQNPKLQAFECSIFDGHYITGDITPAYLENLAKERGDAVRKKQKREGVLFHRSRVDRSLC